MEEILRETVVCCWRLSCVCLVCLFFKQLWIVTRGVQGQWVQLKKNKQENSNGFIVKELKFI